MEPSTIVATEQGKLWAALSYGGFFFGFPIGVVPLLQRDDRFALYHAKHAVAVWLVTFVAASILAVLYVVISFVTCGIGGILVLPFFMLLAIWPMGVGVHGLILSMNGQAEEPFGVFGLGELMFSSIEVKEPDPAALLAVPPPPPAAGPPPPPPPAQAPPPPPEDEPPQEPEPGA